MHQITFKLDLLILLHTISVKTLLKCDIEGKEVNEFQLLHMLCGLQLPQMEAKKSIQFCLHDGLSL